MIYALDTNIISYILKNNEDVKQRWLQEEARGNPAVIPLMVYYEIKRGLLSAKATTKLAAFERVCATLWVEDLSVGDMDIAAEIYATRKRQGKPIEDTDLLIAAQAVNHGYTLVTHNTRHFKEIDDLIIEDWIQ